MAVTVLAPAHREGLLRNGPDTRTEVGMPNPTLVSISVEEPGRYLAVDTTGNFWRGTLRQSAPTGLEFIAWTRLDSEFPRMAPRKPEGNSPEVSLTAQSS